MIDKKYTLIFMGNSGCGKGTQANLIEEELKKQGGEVLHIELGYQFREFLSTTTYTAKKAREIAKKGSLQPEFLAVRLWAEVLNSHYSDEKHLIVDGTPRTIREANVLDDALKFYGIEKPIVIYLNTSREKARERMFSRGRSDDTEEKIKNRLDWFEKDVLPAVNFFKNNSEYNYIEISGDDTIEIITQEIKKQIF
ncbi:MAG: nucleoside monophosphate kinase [Candidatus Pacebacteria bacterium]|nr:nucleoside monophosphate kinase [Candidatus Paceibacterota bacterium]